MTEPTLLDLDRLRERQFSASFNAEGGVVARPEEVEFKDARSYRFDTTPQFKTALPIGTRIEVIDYGSAKHFWHGKKGEVVGYRFDAASLYPTGWHYIQFDGESYPLDERMPYVHRDYLKVIE